MQNEVPTLRRRSPGENAQFLDLNHSRTGHSSHVLYQGTTLQLAENSLDEGTALQAAEELMFCVSTT
jgi:hypothetical protein